MIFGRKRPDPEPAAGQTARFQQADLVAMLEQRRCQVRFASIVRTPFRADGAFQMPWQQMHCVLLADRLQLFRIPPDMRASMQWLSYDLALSDLEAVSMTYDGEAKRELLGDDLLNTNVAGSPLLAMSASTPVETPRSVGAGRVPHVLVVAPGSFDPDGAATIESLARLLTGNSRH